MRTRPRSHLAPFAPLVLAVAAQLTLVTIGACSNQGEGGVCDPNSDDCASNLTCTHLAMYGNRCCPPSGTTPTTQICGAPNQTGVADANVPPADSGSSSGGGDSGTAEASADTGPSTEAAADAPGESSLVGAEGTESGTSPEAEASDGPTE